MKQKFNLPLSLMTVAILTAGMTGCGSSSDSGSPITAPTDENRDNEANNLIDSGAAGNVNAVPNSQVTGKAVDGYLARATVCLDLNRDFICAPDEPGTTTLNDGRYLLDLPSTLTAAQRNAAQVVVLGGIDQDTGSEFTGKMSAPLRGDASGLTNVTPFSTLLAQVVSDNSALTDADKTKVAGWLEGVAAADVTGDPKTKNELLIEAVALQKTLDMLAAGSSKSHAETMSELVTELGKTAAPAAASALRLPSAAAESHLEQAVGTMPSVPDAVKTAAKSVATAVRSTGSENSAGDLTAALAAVSKKAQEAVNTVQQAADKSSVSVTVVKASAAEVNSAKIDRILGLAGYEAESEGETADPVVTALKGFTALTGTTTLEELQTWVNSASFEGKDQLLSAIDNALLQAKANPLVPVDMQTLINKGGFIEYYLSDGTWDYGFPTIGSGGISTSVGQTAGKMVFEGSGFNPASQSFDQPYQQTDDADDADEFFYKDNGWHPITGESFRVADGKLWVDATANNGKSIAIEQAELVAIDDLSGKTVNLAVDDAQKAYSLTLPAGAERYLIKISGAPAITSYPYDGSNVGTLSDSSGYHDVTPFANWSDFESTCLGQSNCSLAYGGDTYLTTGVQLSDGVYPLLEKGTGSSSYKRTVGELVKVAASDTLPLHWRLDVDYRLLKSEILDENDVEKPVLVLHPDMSRDKDGSTNIISKGNLFTPTASQNLFVYSRSTQTAVAARLATEFDKLDVDITYDASACTNLTDNMSLEVRAFADQDRWQVASGFKGVSATAAKGTAYSLKEVGSFVASPENMLIYLNSSDVQDGPLASIYDTQYRTSAGLTMSKVSEGNYTLTGTVTSGGTNCFEP